MSDEKKPREIPDDLIEQLLKNVSTPDDLTGKDGLLKQLTARLVGTMLQAEMDDHLGYEKGDAKGRGSGNSRNGITSKKLKTEAGAVEIEVPRDRAGTFEPKIVPKRRTRMRSFDEKILALYSRGMSVRTIQEHLEELYGVEVSPDLISRVTSTVMEDAEAWQSRALDAVYPILFLDALYVKVRDEGVVQNKAVYIALALTMEGRREVLGIWLERSEGAKFWLKVINELKVRGVRDLLIVCCDGLKGFPDAIEAAFPHAVVQTCIVHLLRNSFRFVSYKDRAAVAKDLRPIYTAPSREEALSALERFEQKWDHRYDSIGLSWRTNWERVVPFLAFGPELRRMIYTTNSIESLNSSFRKLLHHRGHFPTDEAVIKLLFLGFARLKRKRSLWRESAYRWPQTLRQLSIFFKDRMPTA
jgi:putative transposase